jgi:hypothetical protein
MTQRFTTFLLGALLPLCVLDSALADKKNNPFEPAIAERKLALPPDPVNPDQKRGLTCFYYPHFVVKQLDFGEKGAEQLSIAATTGKPDDIPCQQELLSTEKIITEWHGYFSGAKDRYVFFDADDGWNGGVGFAVFNADTSRKIFEDAANGKFQLIEALPAGLRLRYERVYSAQCSLFADAKECWQSIKHETGLTAATAPDCRAAYQQEQSRVPGYAEETTDVPSVIDYQVEATINGANTKIIPLSAARHCRVAD